MIQFGAFKSRPAEIEAVRWDGESWGWWHAVDGARQVVQDPEGGGWWLPELAAKGYASPEAVKTLQVRTTSGQWVDVRAGDWVIREPDGSGYYPCDPQVFAKRWELRP